MGTVITALLVSSIVILSCVTDHFRIVREIVVAPSLQFTPLALPSYRHACSINPLGDKAAFINLHDRSVVTLDLGDNSLTRIADHSDNQSVSWGPVARHGDTLYFSDDTLSAARQGTSPNNVSSPMIIRYDKRGALFVSDIGRRRVIALEPGGGLGWSYLLPPNLSQPVDARSLSRGRFLITSLLTDRKAISNEGQWCHVVDSTGRALAYFARTPDVARQRHWWLGLYPLVDQDSQENTYVAFTLDPVIHVFDSRGRELRTIQNAPGWWVNPESLAAPVPGVQREPKGFLGSWTRLVKLILINDKTILLAFETNGLVNNCSKPFVLELLTTSGEVIAAGIESEWLPIGVDVGSNVYFMSAKGDRIAETALDRGLAR